MPTPTGEPVHMESTAEPSDACSPAAPDGSGGAGPAPDGEGGRRRFLTRLGAAGLVAAGGSLLLGRPAAAQDDTTATTTRELTPDDVETLRFLQGLELGAVSVYTGAQVEMDQEYEDDLSLLRSNHAEYAAAITATLGRDAATQANAAFADEWAGELTGNTGAQLGALARMEESLAATYLGAVGTVDTTRTAELLASILTVTGQHVVLLGQLAGQGLEQYVPTFQTDDGAATPAQFPAA